MHPFQITLLLALCSASAGAADWSHWRGENRDGHSSESSRYEKGAWPPDEALWSAKVGLGSSSMLVVGDTMYTLGFDAGKETVFAIDVASGATTWAQSYAAPKYGRHAIGDQSFYRGPSSTPEFDPATSLLYTMGIDGEVRCWDTKAGGASVWKLNLYDRYEIPRRPQVTKRPRSHRDYGYPTSPFIFGDTLIVEAGDPKRGNLLAFDKRTGKLLWGSQNRDPAGHTGGPSPMEVDGVPCLAVLTALNLVVTRVDTANVGKTVAEVPWTTDFINNIPCPTVAGRSVLVTSRYNIGKMARYDITLRGGARRAWENKVPSGVCTPVVLDGKIYFANKGFHCLDLGTGKELWEGGRFGDPGSVIATSDKRLIAWANDGDLALIESAARSPNKYKELSAKRGVLRDMAWPHVVLAGGRLFCKDRAGNIRCFGLLPGAQPIVANADPDPAPRAVEKFDLGAWPGDGSQLVLGWRQGGGKRGLGGLATRGGGRYALTTRDAAKFDPDGTMRTAGGAFGLAGDTGRLKAAFMLTDELSIELVFSADNVEQNGPARMLTFSDSAYLRNFTLGQIRDELVLRLRTPITGDNGSKPEVKLGRIEAGKLYHAVVAYRNGQLACYLNGSKVAQSGAVRGDFSNWTAQHFWIGDEHDGGRNWAGTVYGFALFNAAMEAKDVAARYRKISG